MTLQSAGRANIAVFRALRGLGDMLCCVPALRALRFAYPAANVSLIGLPAGRWLAERFPNYIDCFMDFPGWPGLPEQEGDCDSLGRFLWDVREERLDLALQMHGNGSVTNAIVTALGAKTSAGFVPAGVQAPETGLFATYPDHLHEVDRCMQLARLAGGLATDSVLEFPIRARDRLEAMRILPSARLSPYACIHPGSSSPDRRWPAERFARVADGLATRGFRVLLTGSTAEACLTRSIADAANAGVVDLAGRTTLGGLAALLSEAGLLVCNDTGVSHLAEALRVPSVVVFPKAIAGPSSEPRRWAPRDRRLDRILHECTAPRPCGAGIVCAPEVTPDDVLEAAEQITAEGIHVG